MRFALTFALLALLCTCGRAQTRIDKLPQDVSSVAFIKGETGFLIDSLTIRTSLDTLPYGFAYLQDTMLLDISIFRPVDELIIETFAEGHSFSGYRCWVDAPSADVHLSIVAGRTYIDSVGLSPLDGWFRDEVNKILATKDLLFAKRAIQWSILNSGDLLMCANFIKAFQDLPNLARPNIMWLRSTLKYEIGLVKRHPWFAPLMVRQEVMQSSLPGKLNKYELSDQSGKEIKLQEPKNQFYVLNFYDARLTDCRRDHQLLREAMSTDSVFSGVPIISITKGDYPDGWLNYIQKSDFSWPHYLEKSSTTKPGLYDKMAIFPASTYVLLNKDNRVEGVFDDLRQLMKAVLLRKEGVRL